MWRERHLCRRNPDQPARDIDHRSAAITRINRRIGLHKVFIFGLIDGDITFHRAKNASAYGAAVANSVTYYNHCLAKQVRRNIVEVNERKSILRVDLNECQISLVIAGNIVSVVGFAVVCRYVNFQVRGAFDDVLVGHNVTSRVDNETGPETLQRLANLAWPDAVVAEELRVKILKRIAHRAANYALGIDVHHCGQHLGNSQNSRFRRRIGLCKTRCARCDDS